MQRQAELRWMLLCRLATADTSLNRHKRTRRTSHALPSRQDIFKVYNPDNAQTDWRASQAKGTHTQLLISSLGRTCLAQVTHAGYESAASFPDTHHPLDDSEHLARSTSSRSTVANRRAPALVTNEPSYVSPHEPR